MSAENIVITGINGFVGEHAAREFKSQGFSVIGVGHDRSANGKVSALLKEYIECDLLDENQVSERIDLTNSRAVIHLAGLANVGESFYQPKQYMTDNGIMAHNLLSKSLSDKMPGRVVAVSTGALYDPNQPQPLSETALTASNSPYAVGKLLVEDIVKYYRTRGTDAIIVRPFNHIGLGQGKGFILPDLYDQLTSVGETREIMVGNLETKRDYTDVRDIARAYGMLALALSLDHDTYNVCSGRSLSGVEILKHLQEATGTKEVKVTVDQSKLRPNDIMEITGDPSRLHNELGWKPEIALEQTVEDFILSQKSQ